MSKEKWKKKSLYIAKFIKDDLDEDGNLISIYAKPIFIGLENIEPISNAGFGGYGLEAMGYGTKADRVIRVLLDYDKYFDKIQEKDLAYIENVTPEGESIYGDNANYRVDSVRNQNRKIAVYFEKLPNK